MIKVNNFKKNEVSEQGETKVNYMEHNITYHETAIF